MPLAQINKSVVEKELYNENTLLWTSMEDDTLVEAIVVDVLLRVGRNCIFILNTGLNIV